MHLTRLELTNFRNYTRLELDLQACIHIFQGENAQGKTNLLEAIYCLATTKSPLAGNDSQLIAWQAADEVLPYASIRGSFQRAGEEHTLDLTLMKEPASDENRTAIYIRKQIRFDGAVKRLIDSIGKLNVVLFLPHEVGLVSGSPSERRRYLDISLCQQSQPYCHQLSRYNKLLTQRNALLRQIRDGEASADNLFYWDTQLAQAGGNLLAMRCRFIAALDTELRTLYPHLSDSQETLKLNIKSAVTLGCADLTKLTDANMEAGTKSAAYEQALFALYERNRREEIARATTVAGPHRDDLRFLINGFDAAEFGSRGQQRSIVLALKLAEARLMQRQTGEAPVILLDDIFSELDQRRSHLLLSALADIDQVLITTTDLNACDPQLLSQATVWQVVKGHILPVKQE
ncbi:MAG: DNA replication/repair protein RecF [Anaerolineae bacterium]